MDVAYEDLEDIGYGIGTRTDPDTEYLEIQDFDEFANLLKRKYYKQTSGLNFFKEFIKEKTIICLTPKPQYPAYNAKYQVHIGRET